MDIRMFVNDTLKNMGCKKRVRMAVMAMLDSLNQQLDRSFETVKMLSAKVVEYEGRVAAMSATFDDIEDNVAELKSLHRELEEANRGLKERNDTLSASESHYIAEVKDLRQWKAIASDRQNRVDKVSLERDIARMQVCLLRRGVLEFEATYGAGTFKLLPRFKKVLGLKSLAAVDFIELHEYLEFGGGFPARRLIRHLVGGECDGVRSRFLELELLGLTFETAGSEKLVEILYKNLEQVRKPDWDHPLTPLLKRAYQDKIRLCGGEVCDA